MGGGGWQPCSKRNRDWNSRKNKGPVGGRAARWEEERGEEGEVKGGGEERAAQQELCPILPVAGFPSIVACCIVKYDNAGHSDLVNFPHKIHF